MRCIYELRQTVRFASCVWRIHEVENGVLFEEHMKLETESEAACMLTFWEGDPCLLMRAIMQARPCEDEKEELVFTLTRCTTAINREIARYKRTIQFSETPEELMRMLKALYALPRTANA